MRIGSLFSGCGALDVAAEDFFGGEVVWHSEIYPQACRVLETRWPGTPNLGDIRQIDWNGVEPVDVLVGGFPCQSLSEAGKREGMRRTDKSSSGLWRFFADALNVLRPDAVFIENVRGLLHAHADRDVEFPDKTVDDQFGGFILRAMGSVAGNLADFGYDAQWITLGASRVGAPHKRERVFILGAKPGWNPPHCDDPEFWEPSKPLLPTPSAADAVRGQDYARASRPASGSDDLVTAAVKMTKSHSWGLYEETIAQWEAASGRKAPSPTEPNKNGNPRLAAVFVEWMMGLSDGWVCDLDITRRHHLRILGNSVVPQQALAALKFLAHHVNSVPEGEDYGVFTG